MGPRLVAVAVLVCAGLAPGLAHARAGVTLARVSDNAFVAYAEPEIANDPTHPGRLLAVAQAVPPAAPDGSRRRLVTFLSDDGAHTWHSSGPLPGSPPDLLGLDVTAAYDRHGTAYVLGEEQRGTSGGAPMLLWRSRDGGRTFAPPVTVAPAASRCCDHGWLSIDAGGTLHVVYTGSDNSILVTRSSDGGDHWSAPSMLGAGLGPVVSTGAHTTVVVAWLGNRIEVRVSRDGGQTFAQANPPGAGRAENIPAVATDPRTGRIYLASTVAGRLVEWTSADGRRWSTPHTFPTPTPATQPQLAIGSDGQVWTFLFAGQSSIAPYLVHEPSGLAGSAGTAVRLTAPFPLTSGFGSAKGHAGGFVGDYQGLATDGRAAVAVWNDGRSGHLELTSARTVAAGSAVDLRRVAAYHDS
jgi:hypothetical protein